MKPGASGPITWKVKLKSPPEKVYEALATAEGRASFWALEAPERDAAIHFRFSNGWTEVSPVRRAESPSCFELEYFGAPTRFDIVSHEDGGCVLTVSAYDVPSEEWHEVHAGWVSVLLALKSAVDFGIDLRNSEPALSWQAGFVDV